MGGGVVAQTQCFVIKKDAERISLTTRNENARFCCLRGSRVRRHRRGAGSYINDRIDPRAQRDAVWALWRVLLRTWRCRAIRLSEVLIARRENQEEKQYACHTNGRDPCVDSCNALVRHTWRYSFREGGDSRVHTHTRVLALTLFRARAHAPTPTRNKHMHQSKIHTRTCTFPSFTSLARSVLNLCALVSFANCKFVLACVSVCPLPLPLYLSVRAGVRAGEHLPCARSRHFRQVYLFHAPCLPQGIGSHSIRM